MTLWSRIRFWSQAIFRRSRMESEMDAELRFHIEAFAEDLMRGGMPRPEALRRARIEFGAIERVKEEGREARGVTFLDQLVQDLRYEVQPTDRPTFAVVVLLLISVSVAATYLPARRAMRVDPMVWLR
jgi:hypothetical protein